MPGQIHDPPYSAGVTLIMNDTFPHYNEQSYTSLSTKQSKWLLIKETNAELSITKQVHNNTFSMKELHPLYGPQDQDMCSAE